MVGEKWSLMNADSFLCNGVQHLIPCQLRSFLEEITPYVLQSALGRDLHSLCTVRAGAGRCAEKAYFKPVPTRWPQGVCLSGVPMCVRKGVLLCMLMWACIVYLIFCTHYHPSYKLCIILDEVAQVVECFTGVTSKQSRMALQITCHALVPWKKTCCICLGRSH